MTLRPAVATLLGVPLVLFVLAGPAGSAPPKPPSGATGKSQGSRVTFGIEPAGALGGDGRPFLSYGATPGATLSDDVAAVNYSAVSLRLQVYATDAVETTGGGYGLLPANVKPTDVGSWIAIPPRDATVVVPPESRTGPGLVIIPIELRVPPTARSGEHSGAIVVSLSTLGLNKRGQNVELVQRVGTRLFVKVAGPIHPMLTVKVTQSAYHGVLNPVGSGHVVVAYTVKNTGNINLGLNQSVSASSLFGSSRPVHLSKINLLLPGAQISESVSIPGVFPAVLDSRSITVKPFLSPGANGTDAPEVTSTATVWAIPWSLIVVILLLVAAAVAYRRWRRRREENGPGEPPVPEAVGGSGGSEQASVGRGQTAGPRVKDVKVTT